MTQGDFYDRMLDFLNLQPLASTMQVHHLCIVIMHRNQAGNLPPTIHLLPAGRLEEGSTRYGGVESFVQR